MNTSLETVSWSDLLIELVCCIIHFKNYYYPLLSANNQTCPTFVPQLSTGIQLKMFHIRYLNDLMCAWQKCSGISDVTFVV